MTDEQKHPGGRPLKFQNVEELQAAIDTFFAECEAGGKPYTITGLALALDTSRKLLCEYEERPEFSNAIKRAKTIVERYAEERLYTGSATGPIFALKNFDWSDKQDVNIGGQQGNPLHLILESLDGQSADLPSDKE